jgi:DNA-binding transcriptional LysR family regulator
MRDVNLATVDLNLLVVLGAVLEEGSATRAAARLHVTQSAVSNALRRARALFDDPLVVRRPHGLAPTPYAVSILPTLRAVLDGARHLLSGAPVFDPATTTRQFTIACSDAIGIALLPALLQGLAVRAPAAKLRLITLERLISSDGLARGEVDLLVGIPPMLAPGWVAEPVYEDPMLCILRRGHPAKRLTLASYAALPHVELALFGEADDTIDRALRERGRAREVHISVPHFQSIALAVLSTDCVATLSARIAHAFASTLPLKVLPCPIALPKLSVKQVWHRRSEKDPAVAFLRALVLASVARPKSRAR